MKLPVTGLESAFVAGSSGEDLDLHRNGARVIGRYPAFSRWRNVFIGLTFGPGFTMGILTADSPPLWAWLVTAALSGCAWLLLLLSLYGEGPWFELDLGARRLVLWRHRRQIGIVHGNDILAVEVKQAGLGKGEGGQPIHVAVLTLNNGDGLFLCATTNQEKIRRIALDLRSCMPGGQGCDRGSGALTTYPYSILGSAFVTTASSGDHLDLRRNGAKVVARLSNYWRWGMGLSGLIFGPGVTLCLLNPADSIPLAPWIATAGMSGLAWLLFIFALRQGGKRFEMDLDARRVLLWRGRREVGIVHGDDMLSAQVKLKAGGDALYVAALTLKNGDGLFLCETTDREKIERVVLDLRACMSSAQA